jgi:nitroreductase
MPTQAQNIKLPPANKEGGMPLMKALNERGSHREFSDQEVSQQQLANLCWAAWGINRPESGKRTAPSSMNRQEMELFVVLPQGAYRYSAIDHQLVLIKKGDLRSYCGKQDFVATAPLNFVYVANLSKLELKDTINISPSDLLASHANTGFMAQNVYLTCASEGLVCVVRAWIDKEAFVEALGLSPLHKVILSQTIGFKK